MKIGVLHGFNVEDGGAATTGKLTPFLEAAGHKVVNIDYGHFNLWQVRFKKHKAIGHIADKIRYCDAVVSHSNGGNFENKALHLLVRRPQLHQVSRLVRIAPALNRKAACAAGVERCTVFYSKSDGWVWLSRFLINHPWGRQGQKGYKGKDPRMTSWDYSDLIADHSDYFKDENIQLIAKDVLIALEAK